jgi:FMN phosphatase YigB (HAD superfamily)
MQKKKWKSEYSAYKNLCKNLGLPVNKQNIDFIIDIRNKSESSAKTFPYAILMLKKIKKQGYKLGIISNTSIFSIKKLKKNTPLINYIDYPLFSYTVGTIKPDLKIYKRMMKVAGVKPEEALMIGDNLEKDVIAPRKIGMNAIHYKNARQLKKELIKLGIRISGSF